MSRLTLLAWALLVGAVATTAVGQEPPPLPEGGEGVGADSPTERARIRAGREQDAAPDEGGGLEGAGDARKQADSGPGADAEGAEGGTAVGGSQADGGESSPGVGRDTALDPSAASLVSLLKERARRLAARKAELDREETRLQAIRADIEARFAELSALRDTLDERMVAFRGELDARREEQLRKLIKAVQNMPPEAAAAMAGEMDESVVVRVFNGMKERNVAKVLAAMKPDLAARVGQRLALLRAGFAKAKGKEGTP